MIWNEILCLGDSLTYGARDRYGRSYPAELGKILSKELKPSPNTPTPVDPEASRSLTVRRTRPVGLD